MKVSSEVGKGTTFSFLLESKGEGINEIQSCEALNLECEQIK